MVWVFRTSAPVRGLHIVVPAGPAAKWHPASVVVSSSAVNAPQPLALDVQAFGKSYETHRAVHALSFHVRPGEILGLVGPNGAGKTSTLRSIAGVLPTKEGRILVDGWDVAQHEQQAKARLAWIPDDPQPFDTLTVWEHLEFTAALFGVGGWEARGEKLLADFELTEKREALGGELSRGMRQKLAFACAWLHEPKLLLMDEPLSGLDPRGIRAAKLAIKERAQAGTAVLLSSHQLDLIEELADRILVIDRGTKVFDGTLAEARALVAADSSLEDIFFAITKDAGA